MREGKVEEKKEKVYGIDKVTQEDMKEFVEEYKYIRDLVKEYDKDIPENEITMLFSIWRKDKRTPDSGQHVVPSKPREATEKQFKILYAKLMAKHEDGEIEKSEVNEIYNEAKDNGTYEYVQHLIDELREEGY